MIVSSPLVPVKVRTPVVELKLYDSSRRASSGSTGSPHTTPGRYCSLGGGCLLLARSSSKFGNTSADRRFASPLMIASFAGEKPNPLNLEASIRREHEGRM